MRHYLRRPGKGIRTILYDEAARCRNRAWTSNDTAFYRSGARPHRSSQHAATGHMHKALLTGCGRKLDGSSLSRYSVSGHKITLDIAEWCDAQFVMASLVSACT